MTDRPTPEQEARLLGKLAAMRLAPVALAAPSAEERRRALSEMRGEMEAMRNDTRPESVKIAWLEGYGEMLSDLNRDLDEDAKILPFRNG
jgi:hypothetical protein